MSRSKTLVAAPDRMAGLRYYRAQVFSRILAAKLDYKVVRAAPASGPLHNLQPGDCVVIKDFRRKKWHQPRWRGRVQASQKGSTSAKGGIRVKDPPQPTCRTS
ncbi:hypothetical protein COCON_G00120480 [Conger conger]|uniref:Uncharacterized protein n=1 Tax=Conger conger TaxID=82655 RepID=A0A9Q1HYL1_CONCO|nr:hypothetical protein COCON_G00120480 [Conger conger]